MALPVENVPGAQEVAVVVVQNEPAGQDTHDVCVAEPWYWPAGQPLQPPADAAEKDPAGHE
jgi:hypothetical protein